MAEADSYIQQWLNTNTHWLYRQFSGRSKEMSALDPSGSLLLLFTSFLVIGYIFQLVIALCFRGKWESVYKKSTDAQKKFLAAMEVAKQKALAASNLTAQIPKIPSGKEMVEEMREVIVDRAGREGFIEQMLSSAYLSRLAASLAFFAVSSYLNTLAAVIAGWRTPHVVILNLDGMDSGSKTLPDLGHDFFTYVTETLFDSADYRDWFWLPDWFIGNIGVAMVLFSLLHPKRLLIIRRVTAIFGFINALRAITVAITSLPDASPICFSQFNDSKRGQYKREPMFPKAFFRAFKVMFNPAEHITCGDMVFSGHTVFLVLCCCVFFTYCKEEQLSTPFTRRFPVVYYLPYAIYLGAACGIFAIIGTRLHYSIDVFLAIYITVTCWQYYHRPLAADGRLREKAWAIFAWLEHDDVNLIDYRAYRLARRAKSLTDVTTAQEKRD